MIIKFLSPHSKQSFTVNYLYQKEEQGKEDLLHGIENKAERILSSFSSDSKDSWIEQTKHNCIKRSDKTGFSNDWNKNVMHMVLSVHPQDGDKIKTVWPEILATVQQELKIGTDEHNAVAWLHQDQDHHHVHLLFSKMDYKGEKFNDSNIGHVLKSLSERFDLEYDLTTGQNPQTLVENRNPLKKEMLSTLYNIHKNSNNFAEFVKLANSNSIEITLSDNGGANFLVYKDLKNELTYHEAEMPKHFKYTNLASLDRSSYKETFDYASQKQYIKQSISKTLNKSKDITQFVRDLESKYNIQTIHHSDKSGKVFGYSFKQNALKESLSFTGSEVGFSFKKIHYYISQNNLEKTESYQAIPISQQDTPLEHELFSGIGTIQDNTVDDSDLIKRRKRKKKNKNI